MLLNSPLHLSACVSVFLPWATADAETQEFSSAEILEVVCQSHLPSKQKQGCKEREFNMSVYIQNVRICLGKPFQATK